jgi:hypothetical protein
MKIGFILPGQEFSNKFLDSWTNIIYSIPNEWKWFHVSGYVPNVFYNRQALLDRAKMLNPTHYMWIDNDQVFNFGMLQALIKHNLPIVSGVYKKSKDLYACCGLDGKTLTVKDLEGKTELIEVKANGMGFMLVKKEVFDRILDPFEFLDFNQWEDFTFQEKARRAGFKSYIDPKVVVGHEKKTII